MAILMLGAGVQRRACDLLANLHITPLFCVKTILQSGSLIERVSLPYLFMAATTRRQLFSRCGSVRIRFGVVLVSRWTMHFKPTWSCVMGAFRGVMAGFSKWIYFFRGVFIVIVIIGNISFLLALYSNENVFLVMEF